ncbi:MAG: MBG domain-containing protein [Tenericutes bacterium]|nr:MBG domain-containing protein [Mycoplasmatota bacterium]
MSKSKLVKKLTMTLFTLVAVFATGLTNVNAETTAEVNNYSDLTDKMNDNVTNVVKLTSNIKLREDFDTTFSLEMSKTLDFNGFTLTVPEHHGFKLIYRNTLDLKFINSNSSKRAKLNLLTDIGYTPIYNEIKKAEYTVNFEMDGIDVEYIKDSDSFWQTAGNYRFNNVVFKNLKVTGFYEMVDTRAFKTIKFSNVTKESKNTASKTYLAYSSTLPVDEVIDADSIIEYYDREGAKIANRADKLNTIDAYFSPITVKKKEVQTITATTEGELINAANQINNSKDTIIKLGADIKLANDLTLYVLGNVTLDLAGHTLDLTVKPLIFHYGYKDNDNYNFRSNLTIKDSGNGNNGKIIGLGNGKRVSLYTGYMPEELENLPKTYGFTIDGGTYTVTGTSSWDEYVFDVFGNDYAKKQNITLNVNVKKGIFEVGKSDGEIFHLPQSDGNNMKANFNFETLMVKGLGVKLGSNILGKKSIDDVIPTDTKLYYTTDTNQLIELEDRTKLVMDVRTSTNAVYPQYIKLAKETGLSVDNVTLPNVTFGYTGVPEATINIANIGAAELKITNVTVSDNKKFEIIGSTKPTIGIDAINTDFKIKAKSGLSAGTYTPTITVTDENGKTYTATVTLKVEAKEITDFDISMDNWKYGETAKDAVITYGSTLKSSDGVLVYKQKDTDSWGTSKPVTAGNYQVKFKLKNENYTMNEKIVDFEIFKNDTEVKIVTKSNSWVYDGTEHTESEFDVYYGGTKLDYVEGTKKYKLPTGDSITIITKGSVKDVIDGEVENTIFDCGFLNESSYSKIVKEFGKLSIKPITTPIVVTAGSDTKVYNGTELTKNTYTYTDGVLLTGDTLEATITGSQIYVGTENNVVSKVKVIRDGKDITSNYTMGTHKNGTLTVTEATQTFTINENVNVLVNGRLTVDEIKAQLGSNIEKYNIEFVSGTAGTFNSTTGFTAGATTGKVEMKAIAPAKDVDGDGTNEYGIATKTFYINVVTKENVTISGLNDNEEFTYDGTSKKPSGTIKVDGDKVPVSELEVKYTGTGYNSAEAPKNAGTYTVTYKVKDANPKYVGSVTYTFTIKKVSLDKVTIVKDTFEYTGSDITPTLNNVNSNIEVTGNTTAKNVSNNTITAKITDKANYEWKDGSNDDLTINWSITQATPEYTVPTGLTGVKEKTLNDIVLPDRFIWNDASTVLTVGTHTYKATYTPSDTTNYKTITDIDIEVVVKDKFDVKTSVDGGNGTITPSKLGVVEGTKVEITFTPDTGYMIDKVLVNTVETTVTGNKIELTVNEEKEVKVSYKKIPFTVTVKDVAGATITPNGAVAVSYGETQEFTITANSGYKLVKVLVDGTDKTADMVGDTLKLTNITSNINLEVVVEKIVYEVTEGANQNYTITKNNEAKFKINADFRLFDDGKVYVDNELVDPKNYTAESGSTIITLKKEFVDTLSVGEHTLKVLFNDGGEAITTFNVARVTVPTDNPQTGDNIGFYIISGILSIVGLAGAGIFYRRKQTN